MAARETVFQGQPAVGAGGRVLASPFQFFTTGEENLRVESACSVTGVRLALHYRFLPSAGAIVVNRHFHTPASDRTVTRSQYALGAGALLNLTVFADTGAPRVGQCFVRVQLVRGLAGATEVMGTLLQGYVTASQDVAWPGSVVQSSQEGGGAIRLVTGTTPGIGAEVSETVPTGARWELLSVAGDYATSAAVATRRARLLIDDGATIYIRSAQAATQTASLTYNYYWLPGMALETLIDTSAIVAGMPAGVVVLAGHRVRLSAVNAHGLDQWSGVRLLVREWLEVNG